MTIPSIAEYALAGIEPVGSPLGSAPLFSIVTVVKNNAPQLSATIRSVLDQTYADFELIIIDGNSTDNWRSVVESYGDPRIVCYSEPDLGIYDAMNKGIARAQGQIIGTLNAGDFYQANALELVSRAFLRANCQELAIAGDIEAMSKNGFWYHQSAQAGICNLYSHLFQPALFVTKAVYQRLGVFDTKYRIAGDYDFFLRIHGRVMTLFLGQVLTRTSPAGVSGNFYAATLEAYQARVGIYPRLLNWMITGIKLLRVFLHLSLDRWRAWHFFERLRQWLQRSWLNSRDI